jgi:hypothetical protein
VSQAAEAESIRTATNRAGRRIPELCVDVDGRRWSEGEVLCLAPAMTCDRVRWDTVDEFDPRALVSELGMPAWTRQWSDGQHRVWVPAGEGYAARDRIRDWCLAHGVEAVNVRVEAGVPFRDLERVPPALLGALVAAAVEWLYPRVPGVRARLVAELDLVDFDDVRSMMYLFVSDHLDRFDADREGRNGTLTLLTYLLGKVRTWPQDIARSAYGRTVVGDRLALHRLAEESAAREGRAPTELERAEALGTTVTDLRRRQRAVDALSGLRATHSLDELTAEGGLAHAPAAVADTDVEGEVVRHAMEAGLTRAILAAVNDPDSRARRAQDPLALAAVYLSFWEGLERAEVARELDVLPKSAAAAIGRVLERVERTGLL